MQIRTSTLFTDDNRDHRLQPQKKQHQLRPQLHLVLKAGTMRLRQYTSVYFGTCFAVAEK